METFRERLAMALAGERAHDPVFLEGSGLGDGLPLVRPGEALIVAMLDGRDPDGAAATGPVPIAYSVPTWWDLAACSALAGCAPEMNPLSLVAAAVDALVDPAFNLLGVQATTGAAAPLVIVDGDAVGRFGLHTAAGALGPGWRTNATIGRAIRLVLQGVGQCAPGEADMATHGQPGKYSWLVAEHRAGNPWASGPSPGRVTVFAGVGNVEVVLPTTSPDALCERLARVLDGLAAPDNVVLLPPESAAFVDRAGWGDGRLREQLADHVGHEPLVVVTGGTGVKATVVPGWGGGSQRVTRMIR